MPRTRKIPLPDGTEGEGEVVGFRGNTQHEVVQEHDGYCTVHDPGTGIFGSGADVESAREDFARALQEHLDVLSRQEALSPELSVQLAYLRQRLA